MRTMLAIVSLLCLSTTAAAEERTPSNEQLCRKMMAFLKHEAPEVTPEMDKEAMAECLKALQELTPSQLALVGPCVMNAKSLEDLDLCDPEAGGTKGPEPTPEGTSSVNRTVPKEKNFVPTTITAKEACQKIDDLMRALGQAAIADAELADLMRQCVEEFTAYSDEVKAFVFPCVMKTQKIEEIEKCNPEK